MNAQSIGTLLNAILTASLLTLTLVMTVTYYEDIENKSLIQKPVECQADTNANGEYVQFPLDKCLEQVKNCYETKACNVERSRERQYWDFQVKIGATNERIQIRNDKLPTDLLFQPLPKGHHRI